MIIVWQRWRDEWHLHGRYRDAGEAQAVASGIKDPGCECCSPRATKSFQVEAIGTVCALSSDEFAALTSGVQRGPAWERRPRSRLRLGEDEVVITRRINEHLVEVYNDRTISYEIVGRKLV